MVILAKPEEPGFVGGEKKVRHRNSPGFHYLHSCTPPTPAPRLEKPEYIFGRALQDQNRRFRLDSKLRTST